MAPSRRCVLSARTVAAQRWRCRALPGRSLPKHPGLGNVALRLHPLRDAVVQLNQGNRGSRHDSETPTQRVFPDGQGCSAQPLKRISEFANASKQHRQGGIFRRGRSQVSQVWWCSYSYGPCLCSLSVLLRLRAEEVRSLGSCFLS